MDFSLLYFINRETVDAAREYDLLFETAGFADEHDFTAVWLPERHFHPFGGAYPNPALAAAALAARTRNVRLRAGSVVMPLHDPLSVVEDWSFVDNVSHGRVDMALAVGWNPNDFVLAPERYKERREYTVDAITEIKELWAGTKVRRRNGNGDEVHVATYPRPVQPEPRLWFTCSSSPDSFKEAGARGLNVLTALLFQSADELAASIESYRSARERNGHDPAAGTVTLMLHTFVGESDAAVRELVRQPFTDYLLSSVDLWKAQWTDLNRSDPRRLVKLAFERYFHRAALFGSVAKCTAFARDLQAAGVDEIASLVDFGAADSDVLAMLPRLDEVRRNLAAPRDSPAL
ncbi:MupA/Atu3671 family FMN-dependent luciferase-like monooxygenase [Streptomyces odontomachi]|uniref:MupA/Atu3671 family FMN-dependent luciferase-like monooxygenase n=1 Tax=Streptomyces odontomachi TaxID=2944940 RepID=UPI00210DA5F7|nr:MupA/Atu3671 family FMN-dependent luciferase-like monooxygenase [Streptomyces sp. ODS25]